jgi:cytochrome b561
VHLYLAWTLIVLAALHALAALKHHFIDRDPTLMRMLGGAG